MTKKKDESVMVRLDETDHETLARFANETGIKAAQIARMALQAVLQEYRANSRISVPVKARLSVVYDDTSNRDSTVHEEPTPLPPLGTKTGPVNLAQLETAALEAELKRRRGKRRGG